MTLRLEIADRLEKMARNADLTLLEADTVALAAAFLRTQEQGPTLVEGWVPVDYVRPGAAYWVSPVKTHPNDIRVRVIPTPPQENRDDD